MDNCWREVGGSSPPATKGTGTGSPSTNPLGRIAGPNGLKLSDGGWRRRTWDARKSRPPASVRWSAWLGGGIWRWQAQPVEANEGARQLLATGDGMKIDSAQNSHTLDDLFTRHPQLTGHLHGARACVGNAVWKRVGVVQGKTLVGVVGHKARSRLTAPSSATEAGEDRRNHGTEPAASLCSLERVVRPSPGTESIDDVEHETSLQQGGKQEKPPRQPAKHEEHAR